MAKSRKLIAKSSCKNDLVRPLRRYVTGKITEIQDDDVFKVRVGTTRLYVSHESCFQNGNRRQNRNVGCTADVSIDEGTRARLFTDGEKVCDFYARNETFEIGAHFGIFCSNILAV